LNLPISFFLSEIPLFDTLTPAETKLIEGRFLYRELEKNTVIYKQGSKGLSVCFVVDGELSVVRKSDEGDAVLAKIGKGQSIGEMAIIDGLARSADVVAISDSAVLILKRADFESMVSEYPEIGVKVLTSLAKQLSRTLRDRSEDIARAMLV
jgi:CRP/FNR family cyclic AMP-dependent transcriptional regulator